MSEYVVTLRCSEVFCEVCGDCIACYGDYDCVDGASHIWHLAAVADHPAGQSEVGA